MKTDQNALEHEVSFRERIDTRSLRQYLSRYGHPCAYRERRRQRAQNDAQERVGSQYQSVTIVPQSSGDLRPKTEK